MLAPVKSYVMYQSRAIPVAVDKAFAVTLPIPLPTVFKRWYGPISPIKAVLDQKGEWGTVGQTRTVTQVGGGSMHEELTRVDPPNAFAYTLTGITGPLAPLLSKVEGEWLFAPAGTGTEVTWRWTVYPKSAAAALGMPVLAALWRGYARQGLEELANQMVG